MESLRVETLSSEVIFLSLMFNLPSFNDRLFTSTATFSGSSSSSASEELTL
ncbi:hypothetical protein ODR38_10360 [Pediococcus acidilactici]